MAFDTSPGTSGYETDKTHQRPPYGAIALEEKSMTRIIVLAGLAGSGKDTAAEVFLEHRGWTRQPLAGPLKMMLQTLLTIRGCPDPRRYTDGDLKEAPCAYLNGQTARHAMQTLGTEWGRERIAQTLWLDTWRDQFGEHDNRCVGVVVTDCRFANEAEYLKAMGAEIYLVKRPGFQRRMNHASEDLSWAEGLEVLWNDFPTADEFQDSIRATFF